MTLTYEVKAELHDIRNKVEQKSFEGAYAKCGALNGVAGMLSDIIQIESFKLGSRKVIDELIEWFKPSELVLREEHYQAIEIKLNQLKEEYK